MGKGAFFFSKALHFGLFLSTEKAKKGGFVLIGTVHHEF